MKQISNDFVAHIGLDQADQKHDVCFKVPDMDKLEYDVIQHTPEAIDEWR